MASEFAFALVHPSAQVPVRASPGDAGMDLFAAESVVIPARGQGIVDTGVALRIPGDCYARVAPRSGLAAKNCMNVHAGVVDSSFRGTIKVILFNHSDNAYEVSIGARIAQLIFERIYLPAQVPVVRYEELGATARGTGEFGSTGK